MSSLLHFPAFVYALITGSRAEELPNRFFQAWLCWFTFDGAIIIYNSKRREDKTNEQKI